MKRDEVTGIAGAEVCAGNAGVISIPAGELRRVAEGLSVFMRIDMNTPVTDFDVPLHGDWREHTEIFFLT